MKKLSKISVECPHCKIKMNYQVRSPTPFVQSAVFECDPLEGGCGKEFAAQYHTVVSVTTRVLLDQVER